MNILITGASRGIGYRLVHEFAKDKENKIISISRNEEKLNELKQECYRLNKYNNVYTLPLDLSDFNVVQAQLANQVKSIVPSLDLLINNAGQLVNKSFIEISSADFDQCFHVNVKSPFFVIQSLMSLFSEHAHIVNIGSMGGVQGSVKFPGLSAYSASKGSLAILTECLAEEFKETNWRFNCLAIGSAQTEMLEEAFPGYKAPLSAKEMAEFIAKFAIEDGKYFNGKVLSVASTTP